MQKQYLDVVGLRDFVFAKGVKDDGSTYEAGTWKQLEGAVSADTSYEETSENRYRDNRVIEGSFAEGPDTTVVNMDILAHKIRAELESRTYKDKNDMYVKTQRKRNTWFALGFIKKLSDGSEVAVIQYKTTVTAGNDVANTQANGVEYQTKEYTFGGVYTNTKITTDEEGNKVVAKSIEIPLSDVVTEEKLFGVFTDGVSTVKPLTPDEIDALA